MGEDIPAHKRKGAVIFDRDGVLNVDVGYAHRPDQIIWIPGAKEAVRMVNEAGLYAFVATNQAGVARGYYTEENVQKLHRWMNAELAASGAHIDAFEYSPYHVDASILAYRRDSDCRKPAPGMIHRLMENYNVNPARTVMVGDKNSDIRAARAAGVMGVKFQGGDLSAVIAPIVIRLAK